MGTVSTIYGLNPPETFLQHHVRIFVGQETEPMEIVKSLLIYIMAGLQVLIFSEETYDLEEKFWIFGCQVEMILLE